MFHSTVDYLIATALLLVISICASAVLTWLMIKLLPKCGMVDKPDFKRHIHTVATPRGGGIGMVIAFLAISSAFLYLTHSTSGIRQEAIRIMLPICILFPLGIIDDKRGVRAGIKLLFQILAAALAWYLGTRINTLFGLNFPAWVSCIITIFWIVALINAFNMIDGVDGLAGGIACIAASSMAFVAMTKGYQNVVCLLVIFIGILLGFLYFNWHPARIFMGDTGSMFIGYLLAIAGIGLNARLLSIASIGVPLLACGVPLLDILLAVWRRIFNPDALRAIENASPDAPGVTPETADEVASLPHLGFLQRLYALLKRLGTADRNHLHHRFLQVFNNNQAKAVRRIYILACAMGVIAIICALIPGQSKFLTIVLLIGTFSIVISRLATLELWDSAETIFHNFHTARVGLIISHVIHPIYDLTVVSLASYCVNLNTALCVPGYLIEHITIIMVVMMLSRNYQTFWNYSVSDDYFRLLCTLGIGYVASWLMSSFIFRVIPGERFLAGAGITIAMILGERLALHFVRNAVIARRNNGPLPQDHPTVTTVIVGITPLSRYYRDQLSTSFRRSEAERILGLATTDRRYTNSFCYGMKVLGTLNDLEALYSRKPFQKVVVTSPLKPDATTALHHFCDAHNVRLNTLTVNFE